MFVLFVLLCILLHDINDGINISNEAFTFLLCVHRCAVTSFYSAVKPPHGFCIELRKYYTFPMWLYFIYCNWNYLPKLWKCGKLC